MENSGKKSDVKWIVIVVVVLACIAAWLVFKQGIISGDGDKDKKTSVLLICLDGFRLDHLGCMGFSPDVTPTLNRLAEGGALFTQCTTTAPQSMPAWASVITGKYPFVHGIRQSTGAPSMLGESHDTLAEILSEKGYPTAARLANPILFKEFKLDQGIWPQDFIDSKQQAAMQKPPGQEGQQAGPQPVSFEATAIANLTAEWLRNNGNRSFFLWVNIFDAQAPFFPPEPYASQYEKTPYVGDLAFVDSQLAIILDEVENMDAEARPLVVLTSSFGEGLNDHAEPFHSWYLYDSTTLVPLIISQPGRINPNTRIDAQVSLVDVAPTIIDLLGYEPEREMQGKSLVPLLDGTATDLGIAAYSEAIAPMAELEYFFTRSLRKGGWKYILAPKPELYDLSADPKEANNLAADNAGKSQEMRAELFTLVTGSPNPPSDLDLDDPNVFVNADGSINETAYMMIDAKDPKDHAKLIQLYTSADMLFALQMFDDGISNLKQVIELDPTLMKPVLKLIAVMDMMPGKSEELLAYVKSYLDAQPDSDVVRFQYAEILNSNGDVKGALEQMQILEQQLGDDAWDPGLDVKMADMFHKDGQYAEAEKRYRKALDTNPNDHQLRFALIRLLVDAGEFDKILAMVKEMGGNKGPDGQEFSDFDILLNLGKNLTRMRSLDQAEATFRKAIELEPDNEEPALALGMVLGQKGDYEACIEYLDGIRKKWPDSAEIAYNLAQAYKLVDRIEDAVVLLNETIEKHPDMAQALSLLAMIRAASPKNELRNGDEALQLAQKACALTGNKDPQALHALGAAYAEKGMFEQAIEAGTKAANQAQEMGRKFMARNFYAVVMQFYRKQQPFREMKPGEQPEGEGAAPEAPEGNQ